MSELTRPSTSSTVEPSASSCRSYDGQAERAGERLDGLPAADGRARQHMPDVVVRERIDKPFGLAPPSVVERSQLVVLVVRPLDAMAGGRVAHEEHRHRDSPSANALRISWSRS